MTKLISKESCWNWDRDLHINLPRSNSREQDYMQRKLLYMSHRTQQVLAESVIRMSSILLYAPYFYGRSFLLHLHHITVISSSQLRLRNTATCHPPRLIWIPSPNSLSSSFLYTVRYDSWIHVRTRLTLCRPLDIPPCFHLPQPLGRIHSTHQTLLFTIMPLLDRPRSPRSTAQGSQHL